MQLTTLFSFATSLALASASVIQSRQFEGDVAVLRVFDYTTTDCAGDKPTVTIGVTTKAADQCIPFSHGYNTASVSYLESGYTINFYGNEDCTEVEGTQVTQFSSGSLDYSGTSCVASSPENVWYSYKLISPGNL